MYPIFMFDFSCTTKTTLLTRCGPTTQHIKSKCLSAYPSAAKINQISTLKESRHATTMPILLKQNTMIYNNATSKS
jgi:hypothetical protein